MKINCNRQNFLKALQIVAGVATTKATHPILENVKIKAYYDKVSLSSTDLKMAIEYSVQEDIEIIEPGETIVPAATLLTLVKELSDETILIEKDSLCFDLLVKTNNGEFKINGQDAIKFPEIPAFEEKESLSIMKENLKALISKTIFSTTKEKTRFDLDNIMFSVIGDKVRFVGTDGKRLAMCEKCGIDTTKFIDSKERFNTSNITIPVTGLQQILKILNTFENIELANIEVSKNHLFFSMDSVVLSILLADGRFPPYEKAMPKDLKNKIVINTKVFLSALKQTCCLAYSKNRTVQLILDSENINISTRSEANGEAKVDIPAKYDGESFMTVMNPDFLMDVLKIVEKEEIEILVKDRESAILLQDGEGFSYILLPIKTEKD